MRRSIGLIIIAFDVVATAYLLTTCAVVTSKSITRTASSRTSFLVIAFHISTGERFLLISVLLIGLLLWLAPRRE